MRFKYWASRLASVAFEYETLKVVSINSKKVGLLCRIIQLAIISYVIGYVIVYKKGYQVTDVGISGLITKVKGVSLTNRSSFEENEIWDVIDVVIPPQEKDAFFITTNALITPKQRREKCAEDIGVQGAACKNDTDCQPYEAILLGNGVKTGKCINSTGTCEIFAWCPVESSKEDKITKKKPLLNNVDNFTVYIKNSLEFQLFKKTRTNVPSTFNENCRYSKSDLLCPIFNIGSILRETNTAYDSIAKIGGVIAFTINWDCNFDYSADKCYPTYSFARLDKENANISKGWNFRYGHYYYINETMHRDLIKAYGLRFVILINAKAGKFNIIPLTMNLGSGVALLAFATFVCDIIVFYCTKKRFVYREAKYYKIKADDAYEPLQSDSILQ